MKVAITTDTHFGYTSTKVLASMLQKIKAEEPKILIHCGDVSTTNYHEQEEFWKLTREVLLDCIIITVMGNHDWWDSNYEGIKLSSCDQLFSKVKGIYKKYDIHHASENLIIDNVAFSGLDGWYSDPYVHRETNDKNRIPHFYTTERRWLEKRNLNQFEDCKNFLKNHKGTKVLITHFGFTPEAMNDWKAYQSRDYFGNFQDFFNKVDFVDYIFYGHSHRYTIEKFGKLEALNVGSDYGYPRFEIRNIV